MNVVGRASVGSSNASSVGTEPLCRYGADATSVVSGAVRTQGPAICTVSVGPSPHATEGVRVTDMRTFLSGQVAAIDLEAEQGVGADATRRHVVALVALGAAVAVGVEGQDAAIGVGNGRGQGRVAVVAVRAGALHFCRRSRSAGRCPNSSKIEPSHQGPLPLRRPTMARSPMGSCTRWQSVQRGIASPVLGMGFSVASVVAEWQDTQRTGMRADRGRVSSMGASRGGWRWLPA